MGRYEREVFEAKRRILLTMLDETEWNVMKAAKLSGVCRANFYKLLRAFGIVRPPQYVRPNGARVSLQ